MSVKYYEVFGIAPKLNLDSADLQKRFYDLSRRWHPDRFSTKGAEQQNQALEMTSLLNDAFRTLRDPVARAEYVLSQHGLEASTQRGKDVPPELLEEVLELNMALEEADRPQLERSLRQFEAMLAESDSKLAAQFDAYDGQPEASLQPLRATLNQRKYLSNLVRDARKALES